ncbi:hypothetical protein SEA_WYBORN_6 [Arthrobacter phage Wyborn]|uniref:Uncharacterized protein n=1 Tax=Arthrobacter phage Wyborn TaxID=3059067 RepID=A0AA96H0T7_9CAUD|nr:hypothetical protein SEA_WYBORN_6 [Arthrobacter phage Wyborn]
MKTYAEMLAEEAATRAEIMARPLTLEEYARVRCAEDITAEHPKNRSYAVGALVLDSDGHWYSRTVSRNVLDVNYQLKRLATNPNLKDLHVYPEAF